MHKIKNKEVRRRHKDHRDYRRGLLEIVPGWMYPYAEDVVKAVRQLNQEDYFKYDRNEEWYNYCMASTRELLRICSEVGVDDDCAQPILWILKPDERGEHRIIVPVEEYLFESGKLDTIPLITVWGIGRVWGLGNYPEFAETDTKYVETLESGKILIHNPYIGRTPHAQTSGHVLIDSSDYRNPRFVKAH